MKDNEEFVLTDDNYHSKEANQRYMSFHTYQTYTGLINEVGCEAKAEAIRKGEWCATCDSEIKDGEVHKCIVPKPFLVGGYVDAYFEGTLNKYKETHPEIFTQKGELKADYRQAEKMIARCERDKKFMQYMSGDKQTIMTGYFAGADWKIKIDSYIKGKAIVDLKTSADFHKIYRAVDDSGNFYPVTFIEQFGYDKQLAIYQKIVEINTGKKLPCYIAVVEKNDVPDIEIIGIEQERLDAAIAEIEANMPQIIALRNGDVEPIACNRHSCLYCRTHKVISRPISIADLLDGE